MAIRAAAVAQRRRALLPLSHPCVVAATRRRPSLPLVGGAARRYRYPFDGAARCCHCPAEQLVAALLFDGAAFCYCCPEGLLGAACTMRPVAARGPLLLVLLSGGAA